MLLIKMASFSLNFSDALCPMECRVTEDLSESDVLLVGHRLNIRRQRLSAASVLCLTRTLSAMISVCQGRSDCFCENAIHWKVPIVHTVVFISTHLK